jgi:radical SAM protein with 4Fe4S-binding SPASM domain
MTVDDFDTILGNVDITYLKSLRLFNFGEPLLHPNIPDMLQKIPKQAYRIRTVTLLTNGQHHDFPALAEVFRIGVVKEFGVSCDGDGTKEDYERLRPPGKYEKMIEFLIKAKELRDRYSPDAALFTVTISETPDGRKRWADLLTPLGWTPLFRHWFTLPGSLKAQIEQPAIVLTKGCCQLHRKYAYVDFDGTVVPCCYHPRPFELGNLKEQKYSDILKGQQRKLVLKELKTNKENTAVCRTCPF